MLKCNIKAFQKKNKGIHKIRKIRLKAADIANMFFCVTLMIKLPAVYLCLQIVFHDISALNLIWSFLLTLRRSCFINVGK